MSSDYYSYSRISTYQKCPRAYAYQYVNEDEPDFENTAEQYMGSCIHKAISMAYLKKASYLVEVIGFYQDIWEDDEWGKIEIVKKDRDLDDYYEEGLELVEKFYRTFYSQNDGTTVAIEHDFEIDLRNGSKYRGVIDRIARINTRTLRIIDFKSGKRVPDPSRDLQLRSYSLYALPKYQESKVEICFTDIRGGQEKMATVTGRDLKIIETELITVIDQIEKDSYFQPKPSGLCSWCNYNRTCPDSD